MSGKKITIINRPLKIIFSGCFKFYAKSILRSILRINRGPDVVLKSLKRGLRISGWDFNTNPSVNNMSKIVHVISNPEALRWAITQKEKGKIKKLIAGPNISVIPTQDQGIILNDHIDTLLLPSEWTKDLYIKFSDKLKCKIKIWPAGVEIPPNQSAKDGSFIVFKKNFPNDDYQNILEILDEKNIRYHKIEYGKYTQKQYFEMLGKSSAMIYLQKSESQGMALQEAWARDVPTLVFNSGSYTYPGTDITVHGKIGAPYLKDESGMFFKDMEEFENKLDEFVSKLESFRAREYCTENLSDEASVKIYLESI